MEDGFYGDALARIHHERFGDLAAAAADAVLAHLAAAGIETGTVTDLGCGSGILLERVQRAGFAVHGVDLSPSMVALARERLVDDAVEVGSAFDVPIPPSVAITAAGEVLGYATDPRAGLDALAVVARRAYDALVPGGVFLLDISGPGRNFGVDVSHLFHDHGDWMLGNHRTERDGILERKMVILVREPDGRYARVDETHRVALMEPDAVAAVLTDAGFAVLQRAAYGDEPVEHEPPMGWRVFAAVKPA